MVEVQVKGGIARIFLNRPEKVNALSLALLASLEKGFREVAQDNAIHVAVLAGRGRHFSAGADRVELERLDSKSGRNFVLQIHNVCQAIRNAPFPVVARLHGAVIGGALEIAAACDLRVAAKGTKLSMPEVKLGIPSVVEAALLPRLIGAGRAAWMVLTGEAIDARKALAWGLIDEIGSETRLVKTLLAADREALKEQKRLLQLWGDAPLDESVTRSIERFGEVIARRPLSGGSSSVP